MPRAATVRDRTATVTVTSTVALVNVAVTPVQVAVAVGGTQRYTATATYADNSTQDATYIATRTATEAVTAAPSSNVASVTASTGLARGLAAGGSRITAMVSGVSGYAQLAVTDAGPQPTHAPTPAPTLSSMSARESLCDHPAATRTVEGRRLSSMSARESLCDGNITMVVQGSGFTGATAVSSGAAPRLRCRSTPTRRSRWSRRRTLPVRST